MNLDLSLKFGVKIEFYINQFEALTSSLSLTLTSGDVYISHQVDMTLTKKDLLAAVKLCQVWTCHIFVGMDDDNIKDDVGMMIIIQMGYIRKIKE